MKTPVTEIQREESRIILNERIAAVLEMMSPRDLLIAQDYLYGMTLEQIGNKHKMTKMGILKCLRKYGKETSGE